MGRLPNTAGNSSKSLRLSVRASLRKLQTDYIDILYVHWWDYTTSIEEVMDSLHIPVKQGTVLYLGVSNTPAWVVAAANTYARAHGKTPFSVYQGNWSVLQRDFERGILPMCRQLGMAICPYGAMGAGRLKSAEEISARQAAGDTLRSGTEQTDAETRVSSALEKVATALQVDSLTAVALAYVMSKYPWVYPIVGGRKIEHLQQNIAALSIKLTPQQIEYLESIVPFDMGYPHNLIPPRPQDNSFLKMNAQLAIVDSPRPFPLAESCQPAHTSERTSRA